jgi:hypothetical protein
VIRFHYGFAPVSLGQGADGGKGDISTATSVLMGAWVSATKFT